MSSRLRGSSAIKEGADVAAYPTRRDHFREDQGLKSYKNGTNRYHFGMTRQNEETKNGRDHRDRLADDPDQLYKKSREHFGAWDIKDVVQDDRLGSKKQPDRFEESRLTNGRSRNDFAKHEHRDDRGRTGSVDRDQSHRSRRKDTWEGSDAKSSSRTQRKNDPQAIDERDLLLREIESLAVDGRSPDRRIRAMIERFKSREEEKMKSKRDRDSLSPENEEYRSKSASRGDNRADREDCDREFGNQKEDRREDRRTARSRIRDGDRNELEESRNRSVDRRLDKSNESIGEKTEDSRRNDSFRQKCDVHGLDKSRRRSRELEDDPSRRKDSPKRRSYAYEGNPEDFDVRIQRYERALLEPRRDLDSSRRASAKDAAGDLGRKESFKEHDRQVTRKSSFKTGDAKKSRESSLGRKPSLKGQETDVHRKNSFKDTEKSFRKDQEHVSRRGSFKEQGFDAGRKNSFKEQSSDYGRISARTCGNEEERKAAKGHGVSRITFKEQDEGPPRIHSYKEQEAEAGKISFKHRSSDVGRKNSFKEKTVEFAGISYKDHDEDVGPGQRNVYKNEGGEPGKVCFRSLDDSRRRTSPNGRYVEFGPASYQTEGEIPSEEVLDQERRSSSKDRDASTKRRVSLRSKSHDSFDRKSDRHSRPLSPPRRDELRENCKDREDFDANSWHESNRVFAAAYLRENSRYRSNPEGHSEIERDPSPEMGSLLEIRERRPNEHEEKQRKEHANVYGVGDADQPKDLDGRYPSHRERNGATIIRIRSSPESTVERRRRRRPAQELHVGRRRRYEDEEDSGDEAEEEDDEDRRRQRPREPGFPSGRGVMTPSRRIWNYREGGVLITDVEEGQPCLQCGETCSGFSPHTWR
nr:trichohyalin-like [Megalopta genalis]